jgi:hypothetical protein
MRWTLMLLAVAFVCVFVMQTYAARLTSVSDLISTSAPTTAATHTITFTVPQTVPPGGSIMITPESGEFDIPAGFDYQDVDLAVANGGPYVERSLSTAPDAVNDGVSVVSGNSGNVTISLNSLEGIAAGEQVRIKLGSNASFGAAGADDIINPDDVRSYSIIVLTRDELNAGIDSSNAMIAIVSPVGLVATMPVIAPDRFNGLPSGILAAGNTAIELSLETDIYANCRFATSTDILYGNMTHSFFPSSGTLHYVPVYGHQNETTYNYYVRCKATLGGAENSDDYLISFTLKPTPISNTSIETEGFVTSGLTGNLGNGGSGEFPNGSNVLFLASVTVSGSTIPGSIVTVLKDGVKVGTVTAQGSGEFETSVANLERGTYGFQLYTEDGKGLLSSLYGTTLTIAQGTKNEITEITIPPTIGLSSESVQAGEIVEVSGGASPNSAVEVRVVSLTGNAALSNILTYHATSSGSGLWSVPIDTKSFAEAFYAVQARVKRADQIQSGYSKQINLRVGESAAGACGKPDMNEDDKVNLVDFSIFLLHWQSDDAEADYTCDQQVNLADFSVMLFNWTG